MKRISRLILTMLFALCLVGGTVATVSAASVGKVKNLEAITAPTSITLSWTKPSGAKGYQVQQYISKKWKTVKTINKAKTTTAKITGLKSKKTYKFRVRAKGSSGYGSYVTISAKTVPGKVTGVSATGAVDTASVKWTKVSGVTGYEVSYSTSKKFTKSTTKTTTVKKYTTVKATLKKLSCPKTYYIRVRAYTTVNGTKHYGSYSSTVSIKTSYNQSVSNLAVKSTTHNSAVLTWKAPSKVSGYHVEKYVSGKWTKVTYTLSKSKTTYTLSGLASAANTQIRIRPYYTVNGTACTGAWKTVTASTGVGPVNNLKYWNLATNSVKLTWSAAAGAKGYYVKNNGTTIKTVATNSVTVSINPGTTYKITVVAYNGSKLSEVSSVISFTSPCAQVTGLKASTVRERALTYTWNKVTGAKNYEVRYRKVNGSWSTAKTSSNTYTLNNLATMSDYELQVRAINTNGSATQYGAYSSVVRAATLGVTANVGTSNTAFSWKAVPGATSYIIQNYNPATSSWITKATVTTTTYTLNSKAEGLYRIIAKNSSGSVIYTSEYIKTSVSGCTVEQDGNAVTIAWPAATGATGYKVVRSTQDNWEDIEELNSSTRSKSYSIAPGLTHNFKIYAVLSSGDSLVAELDIVTPAINIADTSDESKNAQLLYLVEAINRSKFDNEHDTTININGETVNAITYLSFGIADLNAIEALPVDTMLKAAFASTLSGTNYSISGGYLKCNDAASVEKFCEYMNEGETNPDNMMHQEESNTVNRQYVKTARTDFGTLTDLDTGKKKYPNMYQVFEPASSDDYIAKLYNGNTPSAWKNGFSSVKTTKTSGGYRIEATLKQESDLNYHNGFMSGLSTSALASSSDGMEILSSTMGASTIIAEIDNECRLTSYSISAPYSTSVGVAMSVTDDSSSNLNIEMQMDMNGSMNYTYTFTRS